MREIKFRAWDKKRKLMIGSDYPKNWGNMKDEWYADIDRMEMVGIEEKANDENFELMQFTGLKDKNGKEIYEGDWIKGKYREGKILFKNGGFYCWDEHLDESLEEDECEVIGNIYDNQELLTKKL